jgi:hypothetical protein
MRALPILLLAAQPALSAPVVGRAGRAALRTAPVAAPVSLSPAPSPALSAPVLPSLEGSLLLPALAPLPAETAAPARSPRLAPAPEALTAAPAARTIAIAPARPLIAESARVEAVPAERGKPEPLLGRLRRGFRNALSLPTIFDNAAPLSNGADADASQSPKGSAGYRLREKPDRVTPRHAERSALELKLDVEELYVGLREIHDLAKRGGETSLAARKRAFLARLLEVHGNIEAASAAEVPYPVASKRLKRLHRERDELGEEQRRAAGNQDGARLDALNETAIELERSLLKTQLGVAIQQLTGKAKLASRPARRNAAQWTLTGAYNTAASLEAEIRYFANRARLREKRREYLTVDAFGRPVRVFDLEGFDIEIFPPVDGGEAVVTIRQHRWRNALAILASAARDVRNERAGDAVRKLRTVAAFYTVGGGPVVPELQRAYAAIADAVAAAEQVAAAVADSRAPPEEDIRRASDLIDAAAALVEHPKLSNPQDVAYDGLDKALRSQAHTLAGNLDETTRILRHAAELEYWRDLLNAALRPEQGGAGRRLASREQRRMNAALQAIRAWASRGRVPAKRRTAAALEAAESALSRGDLAFARERIQSAHAALGDRVKDLDSISAHVRRRAAALYAEYRDKDVLARIDAMKKGVATMSDAARELLEEYSLAELPEPGYRRAAKALEHFAQAAAGGHSLKALRLLARAREDIVHKRSFRVSVRVRPSRASRRMTTKVRYLNPGTTLRTVVRRTVGRRDRPEVRIDGGDWIAYDAIPWGTRLRDDSVVDLVI